MDYDYELSDEADESWDETQPCPDCGAEIFDDSVRCPTCGAYVSWDGPVGGRSPRWDRLVKVGLVMLGIGILGPGAIVLLRLLFTGGSGE